MAEEPGKTGTGAYVSRCRGISGTASGKGTHLPLGYIEERKKEKVTGDEKRQPPGGKATPTTQKRSHALPLVPPRLPPGLAQVSWVIPCRACVACSPPATWRWEGKREAERRKERKKETGRVSDVMLLRPSQRVLLKTRVVEGKTYWRSGRIERWPERLIIRWQRRVLLLLLLALFP